jgi:hypothetical protein
VVHGIASTDVTSHGGRHVVEWQSELDLVLADRRIVSSIVSRSGSNPYSAPALVCDATPPTLSARPSNRWRKVSGALNRAR